MKQPKSILAAIGVLTASALSASAAVSGPFTTTTPLGPTLTDFSGTLAFPEFNPGLGTLTAVILDISSSLSTVINIQNGGGSSSHGSVYTELQVTVEDSGLHLGPDPVLDYLSPTYSYTLATGGSTNSGTLTKSSDSGPMLYSSAAVLAEFTGRGNFNLNAGTSTFTDLFNSGGNTTASQMTYASITGTVTYDYTPTAVPEPTTMLAGALTLLPFCGGALRKLRKKSQA